MYLYEALIDTAKLMIGVHGSAATGGTTIQLQDSLLPFRAGWFDGGTLVMQTGTTLLGKIITITTSTATAINFATQAAAPAAGQIYTAIRGTYTAVDIIRAINGALNEIGEVTNLDETLDVVEDQEEYDLPDGVSNVVRVETTTETAAPFRWSRSFNWRVMAGKLMFDVGRVPGTAGSPIRLWYNSPHSDVAAYNDVISSSINPSRLAWSAAFLAVTERAKLQSNDERTKEFLLLAQGMKAQTAQRFPINKMHRDTHISNY
jgi:hypothetical protein